jgi:triacylglycerol lipase
MLDKCHHMATLAQIAYMDKAEAAPKIKKLGYTSHYFFDDDGAQVHIVWNRDDIVLCFRGTEPDEFSDIKADLNAIPRKAKSGGWVHMGFQTEVDKVWDEITTVLAKHGEGRDLYITGHSLGGAMATIAASRLKTKTKALYTYGSPRVGTRSFVKSFNTPHYRHVNNNDIVPKVPFALIGYKHHGTLRYINYYGNIRKMSTWQRMKDGWRGRITAFKKKMPFDGAYDHGMNYYVEYTEKNKNV